MKRKKLLSILLILTLLSPVFADEWDDFSTVDKLWDSQQTVTNQEFEQVMDKLEEKSKQKEEKKIIKKRKKIFGNGTTLHDEINPDLTNIPELTSLQTNNDGVLINVPVDVIIDGKELEKGFYNVVGEKNSEDNKLYLNFYQSQFFKGKIELTEVSDDYGEELIDFAKILPFNDSYVKLIFGSIDFNAYAFIPYLNK